MLCATPKISQVISLQWEITAMVLPCFCHVFAHGEDGCNLWFVGEGPSGWDGLAEVRPGVCLLFLASPEICLVWWRISPQSVPLPTTQRTLRTRLHCAPYLTLSHVVQRAPNPQHNLIAEWPGLVSGTLPVPCHGMCHTFDRLLWYGTYLLIAVLVILSSARHRRFP